jgi:hypothetical protein
MLISGLLRKKRAESYGKERFPLSHGTAAAIDMNQFTKIVALGICMPLP